MINRKKSLNNFLNSKLGIFLVLMGPIEVLLFVFLLFPLIFEIYLSLTPWEPRRGPWWETSFIGGENYLSLITNDLRFLSALGRTALIVAIVVFTEFWLGMMLAYLFLRRFPAKSALFVMILTPMMLAPIVVGSNFYLMFQPRGIITYLLSPITGVETITWLSDSNLSFLSIIFADIWHWTPFMFLVLLAGLLAVPENAVKAAAILGASEWRIFWKIRLPLMKRIILIALVIRSMEALKLFDEVFLMTRGGPGIATETISMWTYVFGIEALRVGYTSAAAIIILLITVLIIAYAVRPIFRER